ncbi:hypothetical protein ANN_06357 [Periplaneta americana]|uniref:Uncharacterized protein n=1 Tax=Periplaneta americana TaxID=6978 RepID=A0ABQ8TF54_PERAM|nr:hypothetical protein ANN_06357 [Periplaneta americana]
MKQTSRANKTKTLRVLLSTDAHYNTVQRTQFEILYADIINYMNIKPVCANVPECDIRRMETYDYMKFKCEYTHRLSGLKEMHNSQNLLMMKRESSMNLAYLILASSITSWLIVELIQLFEDGRRGPDFASSPDSCRKLSIDTIIVLVVYSSVVKQCNKDRSPPLIILFITHTIKLTQSRPLIVNSTQLLSIVRSRNMFAFSSDERTFNIESYFRTEVQQYVPLCGRSVLCSNGLGPVRIPNPSHDLRLRRYGVG